MKHDIQISEDIQLMVDTFYNKVKADDLLGPIFENVVQGDWTKHLKKMYNFWETVLLNVHKYTGSPFQKHIPLPIEAMHFERWLSLFHATVDDLFQGEKAEEVKKRSSQMGMMFQYKLEHIRGTSQ